MLELNNKLSLAITPKVYIFQLYHKVIFSEYGHTFSKCPGKMCPDGLPGLYLGHKDTLPLVNFGKEVSKLL